MYGIYANIGGILMVNVAIYGIHTDPMGNDTNAYYYLLLVLSVVRHIIAGTPGLDYSQVPPAVATGS